jgi:hypothetical protein
LSGVSISVLRLPLRSFSKFAWNWSFSTSLDLLTNFGLLSHLITCTCS